MSICLKSIYDTFEQIRSDCTESIYLKCIMIIYILGIIGTLSYGSYCVSKKDVTDSCAMTFLTGILLLIFIVIFLLIGILSQYISNKRRLINTRPIITSHR
jgi:hypothetical protein